MKCEKKKNNERVSINNNITNKPYNNKILSTNNQYYESNQNKLFKVKISELPNDITDIELMELLYEWGEITNIKVINYKDSSVSILYFKKENQSKYFVKALHKTLFEYLTISVILL